MKTYILQKDLPDSKKGDKYVYVTLHNAYYKNGDTDKSYWLAKNVENTPEWFLPEVENDYEILQYREIHDYNSNTDSIVIIKVKRLSDGSIFSVGDIYDTFPITEFRICEKTGVCMMYTEKFILPLKDVAKKQPLFQTEDGKDVHEGDKVYMVLADFKYYTYLVRGLDIKSKDYLKDYLKYFSTKPAAEEYILMNKPLLSLEDILSAWNSRDGKSDNEYKPPKEYYKSSVFFKYYLELAKTKLNEPI